MKSCPFCKSERVGLYADMVSGVTFGQCMNCGAQGPPCSTNDSVDVGPIKRWDQWSDDDIRQSVRRLVGDLKTAKDDADKRVNDGHGAGNYHQVHYNQGRKGVLSQVINELSALIDGKGGEG